nr:hypothetical protein [Tanacetum cinerariifolium]
MAVAAPLSSAYGVLMVLTELISTLVQLAVFALLPLLVFVAQRRTTKGFGRYLGLYRAPARANALALLASLVLAGFTLGATLASPAIKSVMLDPHSITGQLHLLGVGPTSVALLLLTALGKTALAEEILFRGFVAKRLIAAWGFEVGNLAQAVLFGALHLGLFWTLTNSPLVLGFVFCGPAIGAAVAGYLNERLAGGSIVPGWISHGVANLVSYAVVGLLLARNMAYTTWHLFAPLHKYVVFARQFFLNDSRNNGPIALCQARPDGWVADAPPSIGLFHLPKNLPNCLVIGQDSRAAPIVLRVRIHNNQRLAARFYRGGRVVAELGFVAGLGGQVGLVSGRKHLLDSFGDARAHRAEAVAPVYYYVEFARAGFLDEPNHLRVEQRPGIGAANCPAATYRAGRAPAAAGRL